MLVQETSKGENKWNIKVWLIHDSTLLVWISYLNSIALKNVLAVLHALEFVVPFLIWILVHKSINYKYLSCESRYVSIIWPLYEQSCTCTSFNCIPLPYYHMLHCHEKKYMYLRIIQVCVTSLRWPLDIYCWQFQGGVSAVVYYYCHYQVSNILFMI